MILEVKNLTKKYGDKVVVDNISFKIDKPMIFGFLGTNGAGKTTSIRMILDIISKTKGEASWNGVNINIKNIKFGYLPEERGLYPKTTVYNQLLYFCNLKGYNKQEANQSINYWLKKLDMEKYKNYSAEKLSKGNMQKIQFILAILNDPELIFLDEPFSGLDPVNTKLLKNVVIELKEMGKIIILSSHQMNEVEELVDDLIILNEGKSVLQGNLSEIKKEYVSTSLEIITNDDISKLLNLSKDEIKPNNKYVINIKNEDEGKDILNKLIKENIKIFKYELLKPSLNEIFIERVNN